MARIALVLDVSEDRALIEHYGTLEEGTILDRLTKAGAEKKDLDYDRDEMISRLSQMVHAADEALGMEGGRSLADRAGMAKRKIAYLEEKHEKAAAVLRELREVIGLSPREMNERMPDIVRSVQGENEKLLSEMREIGEALGMDGEGTLVQRAAAAGLKIETLGIERDRQNKVLNELRDIVGISPRELPEIVRDMVSESEYLRARLREERK